MASPPVAMALEGFLETCLEELAIKMQGGEVNPGIFLGDWVWNSFTSGSNPQMAKLTKWLEDVFARGTQLLKGLLPEIEVPSGKPIGGNCADDVIEGGLEGGSNSTTDDIVEESVKGGNYSKYLEQLDGFSENKINHIINGSKGSNHGWENLVPDKNWDDIKNIIAEVMETGVEGPYKTVYSKKAIINGFEVEVTYTKLSDGTIKISDAWINQ